MRSCLNLYRYLVYLFSYVLFGLGGLLLSLFCLLTVWLPDTPGTRRWFRWLIHRHFVVWAFYLNHCGAYRLSFEGFEDLPKDQGLVVVSNHPGLMDITYLLSKLPAGLCIFKPAIRKNPVLGAAARRAGYLASDGGLDMIKLAAEAVASGASLVIFPEGTRTKPGTNLNPLKSGFALIAQRAQAPIQLVSISCDSPIASKGRHPLQPLRLPATIRVRLGPRVQPSKDLHIEPMVAEVEAWLFKHSPVVSTE